MNHLLLLSLGPVQDFIHAARRCQDLWFGSWLLSDLARTTGQAVLDHGAGTRVLFPAGLARSSADASPGVANLILAEVPSGVHPKQVALAAFAAMHSRLDQIVRRAWRDIWSDPAFHREVALEQVSELMETSWVATPTSADFASARRCLYQSLSSVKNTRLWPQPSWQPAAGTPKDSLSGVREAVVQRSLAPQRTAAEWRSRFGLKPGEQLCGVSLLKRLGVALDDHDPMWSRTGRPAFHSTGHMAAVPLIERILDNEDDTAHARAYLDRLEALGLDLTRHAVPSGGPPTLLGYDGSLLIESRLDAIFAESCDHSSRDRADAVQEATRALRALLRGVGRSDGPLPYYAFLLADGDRMGRALDAIKTMEGQNAAGEALNRFAVACREVVAAHHGSLLFSGGDDVLALLPLTTAVSCSRMLADRFRLEVQPVLDGHGSAGADLPPASLSVGLALVHHMEDMGHARQLAGRAERLAKRPRNALAVLMVPRSGGERSAVGAWDEPHPLDHRIATWMQAASTGALSTKTALDMEGVADHYAPLSAPEQWSRRAEMRSLLWQVLARKRARGGAAAAGHDRAHLERAIEWLNAAVAADGPGSDEQPLAERVHGSAAELLIGRMLQRAAVLAPDGEPQ